MTDRCCFDIAGSGRVEGEDAPCRPCWRDIPRANERLSDKRLRLLKKAEAERDAALAEVADTRAMTTRRALEVVLSRLKMDRQTACVMRRHLAFVTAHPVKGARDGRAESA